MLNKVRQLVLTTQRGFTLIEMMVVLMIISILLLIAVPQMTKTQGVVQNKGTEATVELVQAQVAAYKMDHDGALPPDLDTLITEGYLDTVTTPDGAALTYDATTGDVHAPVSD
ncbi:competence type IV pilus major pilin ComGC [Sporolactobacillus sp. Y61]|uniref:Competence type IV pilus major pilin ComGC n=1 Tax=Sporolactobacillus sp. Y61 TaxID=3160863 RepID=A0AAU8IDM6_9BACL